MTAWSRTYQCFAWLLHLCSWTDGISRILGFYSMYPEMCTRGMCVKQRCDGTAVIASWRDSVAGREGPFLLCLLSYRCWLGFVLQDIPRYPPCCLLIKLSGLQSTCATGKPSMKHDAKGRFDVLESETISFSLDWYREGVNIYTSVIDITSEWHLLASTMFLPHKLI